MERDATQREAAAAMVENTRADLLSASTVAALMGVSVDTLIAWLDAADPLAPPAIVQPNRRYRFRPSVLAPWMQARGYHVPAVLAQRAESEGRAA